MTPTFPNSPYNKYYHFYNNTSRLPRYFKPEKYFSDNDCNLTNSETIKAETIDFNENLSESNTNSQTDYTKKNRSSGFNFNFLNFENIFSNNSDEPVFEIMGIKLYLDDLIILGLLFILYSEGVKDEMLFLALVLLLIG